MCEPSQNNEGEEMNGEDEKQKKRDRALELFVNDKLKERESILIRLAQVEDQLIELGELKKRTKERKR